MRWNDSTQPNALTDCPSNSFFKITGASPEWMLYSPFFSFLFSSLSVQSEKWTKVNNNKLRQRQTRHICLSTIQLNMCRCLILTFDVDRCDFWRSLPAFHSTHHTQKRQTHAIYGLTTLRTVKCTVKETTRNTLFFRRAKKANYSSCFKLFHSQRFQWNESLFQNLSIKFKTNQIVLITSKRFQWFY